MKKIITIVALLGVTGVALLAAGQWSQKASTAPDAEYSGERATGLVTKAHYDAIQEGMTYAEVEKIIGAPGEEVLSQQSGDFSMKGYNWTNNPPTSYLSTVFQNGQLASKNQVGLE